MTYHSNAPKKTTIWSATQLPILQPFRDGKVASIMNPASHNINVTPSMARMTIWYTSRSESTDCRERKGVAKKALQIPMLNMKMVTWSKRKVSITVGGQNQLFRITRQGDRPYAARPDTTIAMITWNIRTEYIQGMPQAIFERLFWEWFICSPGILVLCIFQNILSAVSDNRDMERRRRREGEGSGLGFQKSQFDILNGHIQHCKGTCVQLTIDLGKHPWSHCDYWSSWLDIQPRYDGTASMVLYVSVLVIKMVIDLGWTSGIVITAKLFWWEEETSC